MQEDKGTVLLSHLDKRDKRYVPNITKGKCAKIGTSPIFTVPNIHDIWYAEEIKTMGINYTSISGEVMQNYSTYNGIISENGLRMENGLNQRVSYIGVWY